MAWKKRRKKRMPSEAKQWHLLYLNLRKEYQKALAEIKRLKGEGSR